MYSYITNSKCSTKMNSRGQTDLIDTQAQV